MPPQERHPLKIHVHIGPTKTATTTIQSILMENLDVLARHGIHVPSQVAVSHGTGHILSFLIMDFDLTVFEMPYDGTATDLLATWMDEAVESGAHTLLMSSEHMASWRLPEWRKFDKVAAAAAKRARVDLTDVTVFFTDRPLKSRLRSDVIESYKHGTVIPQAELAELMERDYREGDAVLKKLPDVMKVPTRVRRIRMNQPSFTRAWFVDVCGQDVVDELPPEAFDIRTNESMGPEVAEWMRQFNLVSTPPENFAENWPLLNLRTEELRRAVVRRRMVLPVVWVNQELRRELLITQQRLERIERLEQSFSWRVTRPLRMIRSWFN